MTACPRPPVSISELAFRSLLAAPAVPFRQCF